jgi:serine/threonine-protein kinase HipA
MNRLRVQYRGWGEHWQLGTLADNGEQLLFEYSPEALRRGLELSPLHLKLQAQAYGDFPAHLQRLPGLICDSLPDGWGMLLMDRVYRRRDVDPARLSVLDRLAYLGDRTMGALTYEPAEDSDTELSEIDLVTLARETQTIMAGEDGTALRLLALLGGSPHGARPKVLVHYDPRRKLVSAQPQPGHVPWMFKFPGQTEHKEVCAVEDLYAQLARCCGLDMPQTRHVDLGRGLAAFGIARFDVEEGQRVPVHTLAGALHADFRVPAVDYTTFLRAVRVFTRDEREVAKAYARAAFNVVFNNRDDHSKNFSFRLGRDLQWRLAPCYDLTYNAGPRDEHQMDVCGEAREITRAGMLRLAQQGGVDPAEAQDALDRCVAQARSFRRIADERDIRKATVATMARAIDANCANLR